MTNTTEETTGPMMLRQRTAVDIDFNDDDWEVDGKDYEDELRDAVETVRSDHESTVIVDADDLWKLEVRWNPPTDSVWVSVYAISMSMEVDDGAE